MDGFSLFVIYITILIFSIVVHEVAHGATANALGDPTAKMLGRLTLNPLPHIDLVGSIIVPLLMLIPALFGAPAFIFGWAKPVPYNPYNLKNKKWGPALVGFAGPAVNILIAGVFGLSLRFMLPEALNNPSLLPVALVFMVITQLNLLLAIFNLVPIPPLDGSKLLFSLFNIPAQTQQFLERNGFMLLLIFIFFGFQIIIPVINGAFSLITGITPGALL